VRWRPKRIAGKDYGLSHLDPFLLAVTPKAEGAQTYSVRVSFGCHTFTRDLQHGDTPDLYFRFKNDIRCFCFDRYKQSLELPDIIRYAAAGRVYFSERSNFLIVENLSNENAPYVAFFAIEKARKDDGHDAAMFVTSAHPRPGLPDKLPAVTFATLVDYKVNNRPLKRPEPRRILIVKRK
jgi:hypothetical protein